MRKRRQSREGDPAQGTQGHQQRKGRRRVDRNAAAGDPVARIRGDDEEEDDDAVELTESQELSLEGIARVTVVEGCLNIQGFLLTSDEGALTLCGNEGVGWPLRCRPVYRGEYNGPEHPERCLVRLESVSKDEESGVRYEADSGARAGDAGNGVDPEAAPARSPRRRTYNHRVSSSSDAPRSSGWSQCLEGLSEDLAESATTSGSLSDLSVLVCGPKNAGKSSFCRELVNGLLNKTPIVAYLEADCGQPEFTPPGAISLTFVDAAVTGPPFMHPRRSQKSCFVGDTTPKTDPVVYLNSVVHLVDWYYNHGLKALQAHMETTSKGKAGSSGEALSNLVPLVINTPGWVKGLGFDILNRIVHHVQPHHIVQLCTNTAKDLPKDSADWKSLGLTVHQIGAHEHAAPGGASAVDMRSLMWLSFCHQCVDAPLNLSASVSDLFSLAASHLCRACPYRVNLDDLRVVSPPDFDFPREMVPQVLNASLVGLAKEADVQETQASAGGGSCHPFVGFGLVRSVDAENGEAFVLTNVGEEVLEEVGVVVLGSVKLPQQLLQNATYQSPYVAHGAITVEGIGAGIIKGRNNMKRGRLN